MLWTGRSAGLQTSKCYLNMSLPVQLIVDIPIACSERYCKGATRWSGHPLLSGARWREPTLVLAAELAVICGCTYVTALLLELLLSPPVAVPQCCRYTLRPVPQLQGPCWKIKPKARDRSNAQISTEENLKRFSWHLMSRGKYIGKGEAAKGEMLADYESRSYPEEISQLHDLTANHPTARVVLHLGVVTVALPGRRSLAGPVGQPRGVVSLCKS